MFEAPPLIRTGIHGHPDRGLRLHAGVQSILPGMAKRRVPQIVSERDRLDQILVQTQRTRDAAPKLRHLQRVGQTRSKQIAFVVEKNLGLVDQPAKRGAVDDAVTVALKGRACGCLGLGKPPATAVLRMAGIPSQSHGAHNRHQRHAPRQHHAIQPIQPEQNPARKLMRGNSFQSPRPPHGRVRLAPRLARPH
ncbi:hypothetical protein FQZ97_981760 [compost metagenome]